MYNIRTDRNCFADSQVQKIFNAWNFDMNYVKTLHGKVLYVQEIQRENERVLISNVRGIGVSS